MEILVLGMFYELPCNNEIFKFKYQELEALSNSMKKEVSLVCKKIDAVSVWGRLAKRRQNLGCSLRISFAEHFLEIGLKIKIIQHFHILLTSVKQIFEKIFCKTDSENINQIELVSHFICIVYYFD